MKLYLAVIMFALLQTALFSRDFTTLSGTAYKDAKVCESNPAELTISYQDKDKPELTVMKSIPFTDLPDEIKKEFKYDPVKAEAFEEARKEAAKQKADDAREKEAAKQKADDAREKEAAEVITSPGQTFEEQLLDAPLKAGSVVEGGAPGEMSGPAEADKIREDAGKDGFAPGEKMGPAAADKIREDAGKDGLSPGEKMGPAAADKIREDAR
ncbi:MAG TPA: hypothetical protein DET40_15345 [Lentisphaeria bacterium]|nr:MAG: hypothetical protein A2X45_05315 [Lentisphaerae bacterium GWF2_50_93]HCE44915.1 hypothetical protein [Lentisphaeria bacterium]